MADLLNPELVIYSKIFDLLEDDTKWAEMVPEGNRVRFDEDEDGEGSHDPDAEEKDDSDFDTAILEMTDGSTDLQASGETFGTHAAGGVCNWAEDQTYTYTLRLISRLLSQRQSSKVVNRTVYVLRKAGARLGLPWVTRVRIRWKNERQNTDETGGMSRVVSTITILVDAQLDSQDLLQEGD